MRDVEALHTAARRYAVTRAQEWHERYAQLQADEKHDRRKRGVPEPTTYTYSDAALSTFPRYNVLHAIQAAVEAMTPDDFESLYEAREKVAATAEVADSIFTRPPHGEIEQQAMADERASFVAYVRGLTPEALAVIEPLPFQRTLSADESARLWNELERRWGVKGYWYPLDRAPEDEPPAHTVAFAAEAFNSPNVPQCLRDVLRQLGVRRVWELRESEADTDKELDVESLDPVYTGDEGYWTDAALEWLVYASHESSVTVAGARLLPAFKQAWPDWANHLYTGPY